MMSCNLLRNSKTDFKEEGLLINRQVSLKHNIDQESREEWSLSAQFKDSSGHNYTVEIWPKGNFSFSSGSGFLGAASKVLMKGEMNRVATGKTDAELQTTNKNKQALELQESGKLNAKKMNKLKQNSPSWNLTVVLLLGLGIAVYFFKARLKF